MTTQDELAPKRTRLAPIAVALVVIIIIAFGICANNFQLERDSPPIVTVAIVTEVLCVIGLIVLFIIGIARRRP
jgi:hypothetical protein